MLRIVRVVGGRLVEGRRPALPMHVVLARNVVLGVACLHEAARQQVHDEQRAVGAKRGEDRRGKREAEAPDEPGAGRQRQERRRQDDEGVAQTHVKGLGRGKLSCHRVPTR
jgi:hypothetical protein